MAVRRKVLLLKKRTQKLYDAIVYLIYVLLLKYYPLSFFESHVQNIQWRIKFISTMIEYIFLKVYIYGTEVVFRYSSFSL